MWCATSVLVVIAALTSVARAGPYSKACNKGPEYWCVNLRNANECGAIGHCLQTVWTKQKYNIDQDVVAIKFTKLFEQLKERHTGYSDEHLEAMLERACRSVPHVAAGLRCKELLPTTTSQTRALLSSELTPGAMCSVLSLCNNAKMDHILASPKHKKAEKPKAHHKKLIGSEKCTWGPAYWCANLSNSHDCGATSHCVLRVWSKQPVKEDDDSVCKICLDMVKQARDQLQSNETQEELKEVFEGSCKLIPIKIVAKECSKLADDFIPELVETLASEMNPTQVCSVAGLCNSERIDKLLETYETRKNEEMKGQRNCLGCRRVVSIARTNFENTKYEDFLMKLLKICREAGSFSDACATHIFTRYEDIVGAVRENLTPDTVCHLSGQCVAQYHSHADEYTDVIVPEDNKQDLPCELCEQLVKHLRDVIITNTTESEFLTVLKGICKQTGNFKQECLSLVEQWYPVIYNYLQSDLKPDEVCALGGICPTSTAQQDVPIAPIITSGLSSRPVNLPNKLIGSNSLGRVKIPSKNTNVRVMGATQPLVLPLERMFPVIPQSQYQSNTTCALCEYILHFIQVEVSNTKNEDAIKSAAERACNRLPDNISTECTQFVEAYGQAVIALLVQEIDPASVCPALNICPKISEVRKVSINQDHSSCALCLFAVQQLETVLQNNRTEKRIRAALEDLCKSLSDKLQPQCVDFVDEYTEKLVEMLLADLNAQEICVYLHICKDEKVDPLKLSQSAIEKYHTQPHLRGDVNRIKKKPHNNEAHSMIETNSIPDSTYNGHQISADSKSSCVICEFVLKEIDNEIKDKKNEDDVKRLVHSVCHRLPKTVSSECDQFVNKYADLVIALLAQELDPDEVCEELKLCPDAQRNKVKESILDCAVCETVITAVEKVLRNPNVDHRVVHVMEKACNMLPAKYYDRCSTLMEIYGDSVISIITQYGAKGTCSKIGLCGSYEGAYVRLYQENSGARYYEGKGL